MRTGPAPRGARLLGSRRGLIPAAALACLLVGCAAPTAPSLSVPEVPATWNAANVAAGTAGSGPDATRLSAWWERFADPAMGPLIQQALAGSTDIAGATARLRQARAQRDISASAGWPSVGSSASSQVSVAEGRSSARHAALGLDASWEPDLWGGTAAAAAASDFNLRASTATLAQTRLAIAAETALQLLQWRGTQARLQIARENLASQQRTLQIAQWRLEAGLVSNLDVEQARAAVAQTEAQIPALRQTAEQTLHTLAVLTGQPPGRLTIADGPVPSAPPGLSLALPAEVLRQRPDVQAAEARVRAAAQGVRQSQADRLPSLKLGGSIGLSALSLAALGSGAGVASLAASISLPVFDAGRGAALVEAQRGAFDEATAAYRAAVLAALQDVEDTLVALQATQDQIGSQQRALAAARAAAALSEQRYAGGLIDFTTVLQNQRTRLSADDALAVSRTSLNTLHVRLYKALGGGWLPEEPGAASNHVEPRP